MAHEDFRDIILEGQKAAADGRLDVACEHFLRAAETCKENAEALTGIAAEIIKIKRYGKAHDILLLAIETDPELVAAYRVLGALYLFLGKPGLAVGCLEKVASSRPKDAKVRFSLGRAFYESKEMERALAAFQESYALGNRTVGCYRMILVVLEVLNRLDEMPVFLAEGLDKYPDDAMLQVLQAKLDARRGDHDAALARLTTIEIKDKAADVAATILYETGISFDKKGQPNQAFDAFLRANDFQKQIFTAQGFNGAESMRLIKDMQALDLGQLKRSRMEETGDGLTDPVFLVGFPRSGTTLINRILAAHSQISVMEERPPLFLVRKRLRETIGAYPKVLQSLTAAQIRAARTEYFEFIKTAGHADLQKMIVDKLPLNVIHAPLIYKLFPNARFVFALRHPCDVCLSCFMQNFAPNDEMVQFLNLKTAVDFYAGVMELWKKFSEDLSLCVHMVRYESLVDDLEGEAKNLISFLKLDWEDSLLDYHASARREGYLRTPSYAQVIEPIYTGSKYRWQNYRQFLEPYFDTLRPWCDAFGYKLAK